MFLKFGKKRKRAEKEQPAQQLVEGVDLTMRYCRQCETEYRSGIDNCVHCGIELITAEEFLAAKRQVSSEFQGRSMLIEPDDQLVTLRRGAVFDVKALQHLLAAERIPSILAGDGPGCGRSCAPQLELQIKAVDLKAAEKVLASEFLHTTGVDPADLERAEVVYDISAREAICPACGCHFAPSIGACPECGLSFD